MIALLHCFIVDSENEFDCRVIAIIDDLFSHLAILSMLLSRKTVTLGINCYRSTLGFCLFLHKKMLQNYQPFYISWTRFIKNVSQSLSCSLKTWSWYFVDLIDMGKLHEIHNSHCVKIFRIRKLSVFLLVRILPHSDRIWRDTPYLSVLSPNAGKYRLENSEYEHFSHSEWFIIIIMTISKKFKEI